MDISDGRFAAAHLSLLQRRTLAHYARVPEFVHLEGSEHLDMEKFGPIRSAFAGF